MERSAARVAKHNELSPCRGGTIYVALTALYDCSILTRDSLADSLHPGLSHVALSALQMGLPFIPFTSNHRNRDHLLQLPFFCHHARNSVGANGDDRVLFLEFIRVTKTRHRQTGVVPHPALAEER